ncbi:HAD family hydrolase [Bacillus gaemokensis]|uniref:HAD family hydrolase n=1 Tax=Bacillus gaemokensis TaxID=574375 RepID=A0A073KDQ4_9BACI|nr:HAD family hydrolase [Bacillus gaemokensis]KEK24582.1 HAD family hydrolase [Bacillus gaemokensis]KYG39470.1 HAD family hydrolase [Bacillus gaemokensis]
MKGIIFDIDGTILDTEKAVLYSLQKTLQEEGIHCSLEELRFALGIPGKVALKKLSVMNIEEVHKKWIQNMTGFKNEVAVFEGIAEVIRIVSTYNIQTGIVTSKTRQEFIDDFEPFGLHSYFEHSICVEDTDNHKPHPEPLVTCLQRLNVDAKEAVYIGDSLYDLQCAKEAGVKFGLALWGAKTTIGFEEADYVFQTTNEILSIIKRDM